LDNIQQLHHLSPSSLGPVVEYLHFTNKNPKAQRSHTHPKSSSCKPAARLGLSLQTPGFPATTRAEGLRPQCCWMAITEPHSHLSLQDSGSATGSHVLSCTASEPGARFQRHAWTPSPRGLSPVCHHVSTSVHLLSPTTLWSHSQASRLIGSPTETTRKRKNNIIDLKKPETKKDRFLQGKQLCNFPKGHKRKLEKNSEIHHIYGCQRI